jgi:ABC-2 type transport system permease protein
VFNPTIARITVRALLGRRRFLLLLPLPLLAVGLAVLVNGLGTSPEEWAMEVVAGLALPVVLPVLALIIGAGVLGSEIEDGTLAHILAKPVSRREIIVSKLVVAVAVTTVVTGVPFALIGVIAGSGALAWGLLVGAFVGSLVYCTAFLTLSVVSRRPVLIGLAYVLIWEGLLTNLMRGSQVLSVQQYVLTVVDRVSASELVTSNVSLAVALSMAFVFTVGGTVLAIDRLRSFAVVGETS